MSIVLPAPLHTAFDIHMTSRWLREGMQLRSSHGSDHNDPTTLVAVQFLITCIMGLKYFLDLRVVLTISNVISIDISEYYKLVTISA